MGNSAAGIAQGELPSAVGFGNENGDNLSGSTSVEVGFYGIPPVSQQAIGATAGTTAATSTTPWGFATSTQANAAINLLEAIRAKTILVGLFKAA